VILRAPSLYIESTSNRSRPSETPTEPQVEGLETCPANHTLLPSTALQQTKESISASLTGVIVLIEEHKTRDVSECSRLALQIWTYLKILHPGLSIFYFPSTEGASTTAFKRLNLMILVIKIQPIILEKQKSKVIYYKAI
jgi:hypothetical protein